jgi:hypothetical protein
VLLFSFDAQLYRFGYGDNVVEADEEDLSGGAKSGGTSHSKQCISVPILLPVSDCVSVSLPACLPVCLYLSVSVYEEFVTKRVCTK